MANPSPAADQSNRLLAALAYPIWLIALLVVLTDMEKDAFMRRHGWTALFWGISWGIVYVGLAILSSMPGPGWIGPLMLGPLLWLTWLISSLYFAYQAYNDKDFTIPVVSQWAEKYIEQNGVVAGCNGCIGG